jgi:hypothetical protein
MKINTNMYLGALGKIVSFRWRSSDVFISAPQLQLNYSTPYRDFVSAQCDMGIRIRNNSAAAMRVDLTGFSRVLARFSPFGQILSIWPRLNQ